VATTTDQPDMATLGATQAASKTGPIWARVWGARGFLGGLTAIGLGFLGQQALIQQNDWQVAQRYYVAAIIILILSLFHGALPPFLRRFRQVNPDQTAKPGEGSGENEIITDMDLVAAPSDQQTQASRIGIWARWKVRRRALGWRLTGPGIALSLLFAGAALFVLLRDITSPLGGWLWAASWVTLLITFAGAHMWPEGAGRLPGPESDFFAPGVPRIPFRLEALLLGVILVVALAIRLFDLEYHPGIFGDEGERGIVARAINEGQPLGMFGVSWWGVPNLYFYLLSFSLRIFGDSMTGDRMLSVICGMLMVWYIFRTGRLLWGPRVGLVASALFAVSPLAIQISRWAGESTPSSLLWAVGFFYLFLALRRRMWSDWVLAGLAWAFNLYFYAAGKLIIPVAVLVGLYCLVRWRLDFFKRYFLGFALMGLVAIIVFMPYGIYAARDNWIALTGRAQETSIFTPEHQAMVFGWYNIPYAADIGQVSLVQSLLSYPGQWAQVIFNQFRVASEVLYARGDGAAYYWVGDYHRGSLLSPLLAVLGLLGLVYAAWKAWDARFGIANVWFWGGMLGVILTIDTPNVQRMIDAWPAMMLFPAVLLDRVFAAAWPLDLRLARKWAIVPLAGLLIYLAYDGFNEYNVVYRSICPYCLSTVQARYVQGLGQNVKGYQFGIGDQDTYFGYGSTKFVAKGVEGEDVPLPADTMPVIDNKSKGAAFLFYQPNIIYLPIIKLFYPDGKETPQTGPAGTHEESTLFFTSYEVTREQMATYQTLRATYRGADGKTITRDEPQAGTFPATGSWSPPAGLKYPAAVTWEGGIVAPTYETYTLSLQVDPAVSAKLEIDGIAALEQGAIVRGGTQQQSVKMVLAKGAHDVRLSATLSSPRDRIALLWSGGGATAGPIAPDFLFQGPTGGLSAEIGPPVGAQPILEPNPFGNEPPVVRRSDAVIGMRAGVADFGNAPFIARWEGTLDAPVSGEYVFTTVASGANLVIIDGHTVVDASNPTDADLKHTVWGTAWLNLDGAISLEKGPHDIEVRFVHQAGPARMELLWTPPGGESGVVPPTVLRPKARSWLGGVAPPVLDK
jgi:4-amino-4-deoxy-L-arabinose transferase-like glycosyltransferase